MWIGHLDPILQQIGEKGQFLPLKPKVCHQNMMEFIKEASDRQKTHSYMI